MPLIQLNNIHLYYEQHGSGPEDLILIGGLGADHNVWKSALRTFSQYFRVLIFDSRGAGQSSVTPEPYTTQLLASDVIALMDGLVIEKAHIVGHSMGGCIAQQIAIHSPSRINKLAIACSRSKPSLIANQIMRMRVKLAEQDISQELLAEYTLPFLFSENFFKSEITLKGFIQWSVQNPFPQSLAGFKNQLHAVENHDITSDINKLKTETLVIAGENDLLMPAKNAKQFAEIIENGTYHEIKGSAHMPHVEHAKQFVEVILKFLNKS